MVLDTAAFLVIWPGPKMFRERGQRTVCENLIREVAEHRHPQLLKKGN